MGSRVRTVRFPVAVMVLRSHNGLHWLANSGGHGVDSARLCIASWEKAENMHYHDDRPQEMGAKVLRFSNLTGAVLPIA